MPASQSDSKELTENEERARDRRSHVTKSPSGTKSGTLPAPAAARPPAVTFFYLLSSTLEITDLDSTPQTFSLT